MQSFTIASTTTSLTDVLFLFYKVISDLSHPTTVASHR